MSVPVVTCLLLSAVWYLSWKCSHSSLKQKIYNLFCTEVCWCILPCKNKLLQLCFHVYKLFLLSGSSEAEAWLRHDWGMAEQWRRDGKPQDGLQFLLFAKYGYPIKAPCLRHGWDMSEGWIAERWLTFVQYKFIWFMFEAWMRHCIGMAEVLLRYGWHF